MAPKREPGQKAYETWCAARFAVDLNVRASPWEALHHDHQKAWAAVEQACAVPATPSKSEGEWVERLGALSLVATEAAAMLSETNHGGLTFRRSESMRLALVVAGVAIPSCCSACPHPPAKDTTSDD